MTDLKRFIVIKVDRYDATDTTKEIVEAHNAERAFVACNDADGDGQEVFNNEKEHNNCFSCEEDEILCMGEEQDIYVFLID